MKRAFFLLFATLMLMSAAFANDGTNGRQRTFYPGQTVPEQYIKAYGVEQFFSCQAIPDTIFALMKGRTFKANCTVPRDSLRYILCLHRDIDGKAIVGEMVIGHAIAPTVLDIFRQLYEADYPIERMRLPDYWNAVDEDMMRENNTSGFNFRFVSHTKRVSKHGRGIAVDINALYNPYCKTLTNGTKVTEPATGAPYLDRTRSFPYKIQKGDLCYRLFTSHGFKWGGEWKSCKDYQHFELRD